MRRRLDEIFELFFRTIFQGARGDQGDTGPMGEKVLISYICYNLLMKGLYLHVFLSGTLPQGTNDESLMPS